MGVYRMKVTGRRKPVLVRADSLAKAKDALVSGEGLKAEEVEDALVAGEKVWKPGDELPADEAAQDDAGAERQAGEDSAA